MLSKDHGECGNKLIPRSLKRDESISEGCLLANGLCYCKRSLRKAVIGRWTWVVKKLGLN